MRQSQNVETKIPLFIIICPLTTSWICGPSSISRQTHVLYHVVRYMIPGILLCSISRYCILITIEIPHNIMIFPLYHYIILFSYPPNIDRNSGAPLRASRMSASNLHQTMKTSCIIILRSFTSPGKNQKQMGLIPENHRKTPVKKTKSGVWTQRFQDMI